MNKKTTKLAGLAAGLIVFVWAVQTPAATPPSGFEDHEVVSPSAVSSPVGIAYEPGSNAMYILEKGDGTSKGNARVRRRDPSTGAVTTALTIGCVGSVGEQGLLGIAFDPDYLVGGTVNRYVYFYYTHAVGQTGTACEIAGVPWGWYNWVVRYHESGGQLTGEEVLLRGPQLVANNHQGGTLRFAPDKTLYISMGDNATSADPVPAARNLNDLRGKMLRINRDGTIPSNNPFVGQSGKRAEIWAYGFRNPYRFSIDAPTGNVYIGDVGENAWEEIDKGASGGDFGWPCLEASAPFRSCSPPPSGDVKPIYAYDHNQGDSVIGGPVYHGTAFPPSYEGTYFFGDYGSNWVRSATIAANGTLTNVATFLPDATSVVDIAVSPAGCLAWVSIGGLGVREVCAAGGANSQPVAVSTASPTFGTTPLLVHFDGTTSSDADQDPLTYSWAFGDSTTGTGPQPQHTYATNGVRQAVLTVNDGTGTPNATATAPPIRIVVGNRAPTGSITSPAAGTHYSAGDTIAYAGSGTDPEDGLLPPAAFSWMVVFHHADHTHPFLGPIVGSKSGSFVIPASGEPATDVFYRIELTVTDSGIPVGSNGTLSQTTYVDVVPNVTTMTVATVPAGAGLQLGIDQVLAPAPTSKSTVAKFPRVITAPTPQTVSGISWAFVSWSDGGAAEHTVLPPVTPTTYTATYQCTANCALAPILNVSRVAPSSARLTWAALTCASSYDVTRGDLSTLKSTAGNFAQATTACVANNTAQTTVTDSTVAPPGGFWFLVKGNGCVAGYDELGMPPQVESRNSEIAASGVACP